MGLILALVAALLADGVFGEPRRGHPLVGFGQIVSRVEAVGYADGIAAGARGVALLVGVPVVLVTALVASLPPMLGWCVVAGLAYLAVGRQALAAHARPVASALAADDIAAARAAVGRLVSRDVDTMDALAIRRATIESVLENASDAIIAPILWLALGGWLAGPVGAAVAVTAHRLINTLDAMWGYRTPRYRHFGRVAARADDGVNWPAARVTALAFVALGDRRAAWRCWRTQARYYDSPNAGPVMAAGAGALGVRLGGGAIYHDQWRDKAEIGCGALPDTSDITRALGLVDRAVAGVAALCIVLTWL